MLARARWRRRLCTAAAELQDKNNEEQQKTKGKVGLGLRKCLELLRGCRRAWEAPKLHNRVAHSEAWVRNRAFVSNFVIDMYGRCGCPNEARKVFDELGNARNSHSLAFMLKSMLATGDLRAAVDLFDEHAQLRDEVCSTTMVSALAAAGQIDSAEQVFASIDSPNVVSWTAMLSCYAKQGLFAQARSCFDKMPSRNEVSWTALVSAYAQCGHLREAADVLLRMPQHDLVSASSVVQAAARVGLVDMGMEIRKQMQECSVVADIALIKAMCSSERMKRMDGQVLYSSRAAEKIFLAMPKRDGGVWAAMLHHYADAEAVSKLLSRAKAVFQRMPAHDMASWNSMLTAFARAGECSNAVKLIQQMPEHSAGTWNALLAGLAERGNLPQAEHLFHAMPVRNAVSWAALLATYAQKGHLEKATNLLRLMHLEGVRPNSVSLLSLLVLSGGVEAAREDILCAVGDHGLELGKDHFCAMAALLARSGRLGEAEDLLEHMPFVPDAASWRTLASCCVKESDAAQRATVRAEELEGEEDGVLATSIRQAEVMKQRLQRGNADAAALLHPQIYEIHAKLRRSCFAPP